MPKRDERLSWLYAAKLNSSEAAVIQDANKDFLVNWIAGSADLIPCVDTDSVSDRLWLFRLKSTDGSCVKRFKKALDAHVKKVREIDVIRGREVKLRTSLPTPMVTPRLEAWPRTDIGLHSVNDDYNGMLVTYSYYEKAGKMYPAHLQFRELQELCDRVKPVWSALVCECCKSSASCCEFGCFKCFEKSCPRCVGTGWKEFAAWEQGGCKIDYSSGFPLAQVP
jgi:hypothetical protein